MKLHTNTELDVEVAEKVMGWTEIRDGCYTPAGTAICGTLPNGEPGLWGTGRAYVPRYGNNLSDAWKVVDEMSKRGYALRLHATHPGSEVYVAAFVDADIRYHYGAGGTPAETICHAALKVAAGIERSAPCGSCGHICELGASGNCPSCEATARGCDPEGRMTMRADPPEENIDVIRRALALACTRIEDGPQLHHEANDAQGWAERYIQQAAAEMKCGRCDGTGTWADDKCDDCGGMGYALPPAPIEGARRERTP